MSLRGANYSFSGYGFLVFVGGGYPGSKGLRLFGRVLRVCGNFLYVKALCVSIAKIYRDFYIGTPLVTGDGCFVGRVCGYSLSCNFLVYYPKTVSGLDVGGYLYVFYPSTSDALSLVLKGQ